MGFDYNVDDIGFEEEEDNNQKAYDAFMQSMTEAVKVPVLGKINVYDEVVTQKSIEKKGILQAFGSNKAKDDVLSYASTAKKLETVTESVRPALSPIKQETVSESEKQINQTNVRAENKAVEVEERVAEQVDVPIERDATKMVGDYKSVMPEVPEDQTIFEAVADKEPEEYKGGMVNVTKYFEECEYPQIHLDTKVLEHSYVMNSLRALMVSQPITFKLPPGTRDPGEIYNAKRKKGTADEEEKAERRHLNLTEVQMRDANIMKFTVLIDFEDGSVVKLPGVMFSSCLNSFLEAPVFSKVDKWIMLDENTKLSGDVMYALYTPIPDYTEEEMWIDE